ncbi:MAG: type III PLP-dependent enzyme [Planctomycetota bacterium]|jgi:ornithine decarboxylase|nr:type III PLP-dependent enzyme [Planctomycetota bacterium]
MSINSYPDPALLRATVAEHGVPVLLLSCETIRSQYRSLHEALPGVELHYALKPLPHPDVVAALADEGASFDLATNGEVDVVRAAGIAPERCIHTHPIKRDGDISHALAYGCTTFVVDNPYELDKFLPYRDQAEILVRISFRSSDAVVDLSYKFGIAPDQALDLITKARDMGIKVRGLCFHVGSQSAMSYKHVEAIGFCRQLFNLAALEGIELDTLDIGGGFPVPYTEPVMPIDDFCRPIVAALERDFSGTRILAEPGRFISAPSMTLVSSVMGKSERGGTMWYYLDDGLYGSYSGKLYDHCNYQIIPLKLLEGEEPDERRPSVIAGPTCDSIDVIYEGQMLPELECGDLLVSPMMGAYTWATATEFNFFPKTKIVRVD